jgi:transcriptional regulator with XRE-family HTH domain
VAVNAHLTCAALPLEQARFIAGLGDPHGGRAVVRPLPGAQGRDLYRLGRALNTAVGAIDDVLCGNTSAAEELRFARCWWSTLGVHTAIVANVEHLPPTLLRELVAFAADVELADLWLVSAYDLTRQQLDALGPVARTEAPELLAAFGYPDGPEPTPPGTVSPWLPAGLALPTVDFAVARAEAHKRLPTHLLAGYERLWTRAWQATDDLARPAGASLDDLQFAAHLQGLLDDCHNLPEMTVTCQAAQAALAVNGWRLASFDLAGLLTRLAHRPTPAQRTPAHWRRLHAFRRPWRPAAVALYAAGLTVDQVHDTNIGDVAVDGSTVQVDDRTVHIPVHGRPFVRAQLRCRDRVHAQGRHPFIAHDEDYARVQHNAITRQLQAAAEEVGFPLEADMAARTVTRDAAAPFLLRLDRVAEVALRPDTVPTTAASVAVPAPPASGPDGRDTPHLDADRLRRRRLELQLAVDDLARRVGLRRNALVQLEATGDISQLSALQLVGLAAELAVHVDDLLDRPVQAPADDAAQLGSLLHAARTLVPLEHICDTLHWSLDRAREAADTLDAQLQPAGMRVHRNRGCVSVVAVHEAANVEATQQLLRRHRARRLFMRADAQVLLNLLDPSVPLAHNPDRARARLRTAGMITDDDQPEVTEEVLFSLGLSNKPPAPREAAA